MTTHLYVDSTKRFGFRKFWSFFWLTFYPMQCISNYFWELKTANNIEEEANLRILRGICFQQVAESASFHKLNSLANLGIGILQKHCD